MDNDLHSHRAIDQVFFMVNDSVIYFCEDGRVNSGYLLYKGDVEMIRKEALPIEMDGRDGYATWQKWANGCESKFDERGIMTWQKRSNGKEYVLYVDDKGGQWKLM